MEPSSLKKKTLHLQKDEFALSKDQSVSLWIDYGMHFGESPIIREVCGGDFVIINDDLYDEFNKFKCKLSYLFSSLDGTCNVVEVIELLMLWGTSSNISTKPLEVLEKTSFSFPASDLVNLCQ